MKKFKQFKFYSQDEQQILEVVSIFKKLGYRVVDGDFIINEAVVHNGFCAWDDGEITSGWLTDDDFEQVTLEGLKEVVGETNKCINTLSNNFTVDWEQVFGETLMDSAIKTVKQNKESNMKNDRFTLERLLGCEVLFGYTLYHVHYIYHAGAVGHLVLETDTRRAYVSDFNLLTFFTEDGDELTFDEYVQLYYPKG